MKIIRRIGMDEKKEQKWIWRKNRKRLYKSNLTLNYCYILHIYIK